MNEHILTKLFWATIMHLYTNPKRGFLKILNFEQARHFCSKQAVQKQSFLIRPTVDMNISQISNKIVRAYEKQKKELLLQKV